MIAAATDGGEKRGNVAGAALEQSVLESKDKDTLLEMAKALGVKASSRLKKADIITKILDTTGAPASSAPSSNGSSSTHDSSNGTATATPADASSDVAQDSTPADASKDAARDASPADAPKDAAQDSTPADAPKDAARDASPAGDSNGSGSGDVPTGPDGEPLADWEIALAAEGVDTTVSEVSGSSTTKESGDRADRGDRTRADDGDKDRQGDRSQNKGGQNNQGQKNQGGEGQKNQGKNQGGQNNQGGQGNQNKNNQNNNQNQPGEGNSRRRRRRRKNRGGQEGPQGDDAELLDNEQQESAEPIEVEGYLDMRDEGYGFLRVNGYLPRKQDAYIPVKLARQYGLRKGDLIRGKVRPAQRNEKNPALLEVFTVNGGDPEAAKKRPRFEDLTALFPDEKLTLEDPSDPGNMTARIIDLVSPIGKGQRGIIVSPPKAGKTTVVKTIAKSIELNNPEVELIMLLVDERPEEVTDMQRSVRGEVISSTFDKPSDEHTAISEMAIAKAKRRVEEGKDVVIILDGITRLSRAYNLAAPASGRILSGGIDAGALYPPKKFFGAARNVEEGGSLTILATALVDTNSRMDEAIFEEFKGTGNMELRLDRKVAERRIYPAIDVDASSTRHEELLFDRKQLQMVWKLRRVLSGLAAEGSAAPGLELLIDRLKTFRTNAEFLSEIAKQPGM